MPLPKFTPIGRLPLTPMQSNMFEIIMDLPKAIMENIVEYKLDLDRKTLNIAIQICEEYVNIVTEISPIEYIKILNFDSNGTVLIETKLEHINPNGIDLSGSYESSDLLIGTLSFGFSTCYQTSFHK